MSSTKPHFLLFCEGSAAASGESGKSQRGRWRFVLENVETGEKTEATDVEPGSPVDRCALISILRGLEALEQPSRVTLVTTNRYVTRGLQYGLAEWRGNDFSWERFGSIQPIRNDDLWRRIDRTLAFHQVQCRWMPQDEVGTDDFSTETIESSSVEHFTQPASLPLEAPTKSPSHKTPVGTSAESFGTTVATARRGRVGGSIAHSQRNATVRAELSTSLPQRVFVDSPAATASAGARSTLFASSVAVSQASNLSSAAIHSDATLQSEETTAGRLKSRLWGVFSLITRPLRAIWRAVLVVDEWLESYLRCLLLMDPQASRSRLSRQKLSKTNTKTVDSSTNTQNHPFSL